MCDGLTTIATLPSATKKLQPQCRRSLHFWHRESALPWHWCAEQLVQCQYHTSTGPNSSPSPHLPASTCSTNRLVGGQRQVCRLAHHTSIFVRMESGSPSSHPEWKGRIRHANHSQVLHVMSAVRSIAVCGSMNPHQHTHSNHSRVRFRHLVPTITQCSGGLIGASNISTTAVN